jgi:hypothetical protein
LVIVPSQQSLEYFRYLWDLKRALRSFERRSNRTFLLLDQVSAPIDREMRTFWRSRFRLKWHELALTVGDSRDLVEQRKAKREERSSVAELHHNLSNVLREATQPSGRDEFRTRRSADVDGLFALWNP